MSPKTVYDLSFLYHTKAEKSVNFLSFSPPLDCSLSEAQSQSVLLAVLKLNSLCLCEGVGGTVASESDLSFAETLLSRVLASSLAPWPDGGPEILRSH
ncbi:hypothetical protein PoB_001651700 [Plakobranchus ocellatus]|uniref:Uncharacterized protein n=1 Tax=Plakobranchus ocellatus TaxID=259542 RepID=A0AAV3Z660_9GAST|nr:hypothetical protein PoB_001651700 [Plakobranchus ocellatus]